MVRNYVTSLIVNHNIDMTLTITPSFGTSLIPPVYQLIANASYGDLTILILLLIGGAAYISNGILWDKPDPYHYKWFERPQSTFTSFAADAKNTRNIAEKLTESGKQAVIFWGSQSGTAEAFAHRRSPAWARLPAPTQI